MAVTYEPYISAALKEGPEYKILFSAGEKPGLISDVLAAPADGYYVFQGSPNEVILSPLANAAVKLKAFDTVLKAGDLFLFSSKTIPGNEKEVGRVINAMSAIGVDIVEDSGGKYHVSGHANRPDLEHVHRLFLPDMLLPMHGEHRHLRPLQQVKRPRGHDRTLHILAPQCQ